MVKLRNNLKRFSFYWHWLVLVFVIAGLVVIGRSLLVEKNQLVGQKVELAKLEDDLSRLDLNLTQQEQYRSKIDLIYASLPTDFDQVVEAVSRFDRVAQSQGQTIEIQLAEKSEKEANGLPGLLTNIRANTDYPGLVGLINGLAQLPYHSRVSSLQINGTGGQMTEIINLKLFLRE